VPKRVAELD